MLYELRAYEAVPGRMERLHDRFATITLGYFAKHGIIPVAFFTDLVGRPGWLTYILRYDDMAHRERAWNAFAADPERLAAFAQTELDGPLVASIENRLLTPTYYSPTI
jgi:hypothetical protein